MDTAQQQRLSRQRRHVRRLIEQGRWGEARRARGFYSRQSDPAPLPSELVRELETLRDEFLRKRASEN